MEKSQSLGIVCDNFVSIHIIVLTPVQIQNLRLLYQEHSIKAVAALTGYSHKTVHKYIRDLVQPTDDVRISQVYRATGNMLRAATICGVSHSTVSRAMRRLDLPIKPKSQKDWKKLYHTLRARVSKSEWRARILERDNHKCVLCRTPSKIVHHIQPLAKLRDQVLSENLELDPFRCRRELRYFTDLVMEKHHPEMGHVLCRKCHEQQHQKSPNRARR
jgi:DNA-binding CsgD family transcriptional regulator